MALKKRGLGPDQSHYDQSRLWSILHTTLAQITRITPSEYTLNILHLKYFHCSRFLSNLRLLSKTEFSRKIFTVLSTFLTIKIFEQLCAYPEKQSLPWNFSLYSIHCTFYIQDFWVTCACPEFAVLNIYFLQWRSGRFGLFLSQICECMNWME